MIEEPNLCPDCALNQDPKAQKFIQCPLLMITELTPIRREEWKWLETQTELRKELAGQWVALEWERLVAHGPRLKDVLEQSRAQGVEHPFVVRLPEADDVVIIV